MVTYRLYPLTTVADTARHSRRRKLTNSDNSQYGSAKFCKSQELRSNFRVDEELFYSYWLSIRALDSTQPLIKWVLRALPRGPKRPSSEADHSLMLGLRMQWPTFHSHSFVFWNVMLEKIMEISWTDRVKNKGVLQWVKDESNVPRKMQWGKANWIGHILRRNCLLERLTEGKIEVKVVTGRRGRRHKLLLHDLKETRRYWK